MRITKSDLTIIILLLVFVSIGIYGINSIEFIVGKETINFTLKWCGIPILLLALYYAFKSTFAYHKSAEIWRNLVGFVIMTFIMGMVFFISFQGLIILINNNLGDHKEYQLQGKIVNLDYPKDKKIGNKYSIEIKREIELDTIKLDVPTNHYLQGQKFTKKMKIGYFGFLYAKE